MSPPLCPKTVLFSAENVVIGTQLDAVDLQIVAELDLNSRASFSDIAKKLRLTRRTIQRRVAKLQKTGFIRSFEILFDQTALGLAQAVCNLRVRSNHGLNTVRERILNVEGVTEVLTFIGGVLVTYVSYRNQEELEQILRKLGSIEGVADMDYEVSPKTEASGPLLRSDWEIVNSLNHQARRELVGIAREFGVTSRTIQRRLQSLVDRSLVRFGLQVDISVAKDLFPYILMIRLQPGSSKQKILSDIQQSVPHIWRTLKSVNPFLITLASSAERLSDLEHDVESIRTTSGVQAVSVLFNTSDASNNKWLDKAIRDAAQPPTPY